MRRLLVVVGLSACGFDGSPGVPVDGQPQPDGSGCTPGFVNLCGLTPLEQDLVVDFGIAKEVDTDMASCTAVMQSDGTSVCLLYYQNISIAGTLFAHGSRPLALAASDRLELSGELDVSSRRTRSLQPGAGSGISCAAFAQLPGNNVQGGGGGAGGTFLSFGGPGGNGAGSVSLPGLPPLALVLLPTVLRAGCPGGNGGDGNLTGNRGEGGAGGGAVYLAGRTAMISGRILAGGAGGAAGGAKKGGGGGGGSGGAIVIQGSVVTVSGLLLASGAGGGGGGDNNNPGGDGTEPSSTAPATGGTARPASGVGGAGATGANGANGLSANDGGGGGGGGTGLILVLSPAPTVTGMQAPLPRVRAK